MGWIDCWPVVGCLIDWLLSGLFKNDYISKFGDVLSYFRGNKNLEFLRRKITNNIFSFCLKIEIRNTKKNQIKVNLKNINIKIQII